jgi:predicted TIM-barrel fold metal-dependent hydrolase
MPTVFASDPVDSFREHVWVAPFYEDNLGALKEDLGLSHLLFGSDWPHAEGLAEPKAFAEDLHRFGYDQDEIHTVMAVNGWPLTRRI